MADEKNRKGRQERPETAAGAADGADTQQQGGGLFEAWEEYNRAEDALYSEIAKNPDMLPIPGADGANPAEAILYTGKGTAGKEITDILTGAQNMLTTAKAIANSDAANTLKQAFATLWNYLSEHSGDIKEIVGAANILAELEPYIKAELDERAKDPEFTRLTVDDLLADTDSSGNPVKSIWNDILDRARERQEEAQSPQLPSVHYKPGYDVKTVTDKLSNIFFALSAPPARGGDINGQRQFIPLKYEGKGAKKEITLYYDYVFNESIIKAFGLEKKFNDYDFFVMTALDNLFMDGNAIVSLTKIWREMGNDGTPGAKNLTELTNSLRKGLSTTIAINDLEVQKAWGNKTDKWHEIISPVFPIQIMNERFIANGQTASGMVRINGLSPFFMLAQSINHYGTWNKDILQLYKGRRTRRYYSVMHYLIGQIGWMRNAHSKRSNKITFQDLYSYTGDKTPRAQQLAKTMFYRLLDDVFIPAGYVKAYKEDTTGEPGTLLYTDNPPQIEKKSRPLLPGKGQNVVG